MEMRVYTVKDMAEILRVSEKTVYGLIHDQKIECVWVRGQIRVTSEQLAYYLQGGADNARRNKR